LNYNPENEEGFTTSARNRIENSGQEGR